MNDDIRSKLDEAIKRELNNLKETSPGTEEYQETLENLDKLYRLRIDEDTVVNEEKKNRMERYFKLGLDLTAIVVPILAYNKWVKWGFEFERNGIITSSTHKDIRRWLSPKKVK